MEKIFIEGTRKTPTISFDFDTGKMDIEGNSTPEDPNDFFEPIYNKLVEYVKDPAEDTLLDIRLTYFNTSSSKWILYLLKEFKEIHKTNKKLTINWYYDSDDEDILEAGEDYQAILRIPINFIAN